MFFVADIAHKDRRETLEGDCNGATVIFASCYWWLQQQKYCVIFTFTTHYHFYYVFTDKSRPCGGFIRLPYSRFIALWNLIVRNLKWISRKLFKTFKMTILITFHCKKNFTIIETIFGSFCSEVWKKRFMYFFDEFPAFKIHIPVFSTQQSTI